MNHTQNYQLSQWVKSDQVKMEDFNADNAKIDGAIKAVDTLARSKADSSALAALSQTVAGHTSTLSQKGNCSIGTFTYTGTGACGQAHPTRITFPKKPIMYVILCSDLMIGGASRAVHTYAISGGYAVVGIGTSWSGNTLSFYASDADEQMNSANTMYQVIAFYAE